jgi:flagellar biosynthetic protein FliQ
MTVDVLIETVREMLWVTALLAMPVLGVALVVGLVIGLVQAITSIQEQTLSFVPKLLAMALVFVLLGSWMTRVLVGYTTDLFSDLPRFAGL